MSFGRVMRIRLKLHAARVRMQWWSYEVRHSGKLERTYLKKGDAMAFASSSQKVRGGFWWVVRRKKHTVKTIVVYEGIRYE